MFLIHSNIFKNKNGVNSYELTPNSCGNAGFRPLSTEVNDLLSRQSLFLTGCYFQNYDNVPKVRFELTCNQLLFQRLNEILKIPYFQYESEEIFRYVCACDPSCTDLNGFSVHHIDYLCHTGFVGHVGLEPTIS